MLPFGVGFRCLDSGQVTDDGGELHIFVALTDGGLAVIRLPLDEMAQRAELVARPDPRMTLQ